MADQKLTALGAIAAATVDDILYLVNDPLGVPVSYKITFDNFQKSITDVGNIVTGTWSAAFPADSIDADALNWGVGAGQISAVDIPIADAGVIITATDVEGALQENRTAIDLNTAKETNVSTDLSLGALTATTMVVASSDGTDATLIEADTTNAGLLGSDKWDEIVANTLKNTNVSTDLSQGTRTATTVDVNSSDGTNATLVEADTTNAGILGSDKWDEIVANTTHAGLVNEHLDWTADLGATNINAGNYTDTNTTAHASFSQLDYASAGHTGFAPALGADDNYVTDVEKAALHSQNTDTDLDATFEATFVKKTDNVNVLADITSAGANIEDAVTKRHSQNTDTALGSDCVALDHVTPATDTVGNYCYGTGDPPAANTTTEGALFVKYTA